MKILRSFKNRAPGKKDQATTLHLAQEHRRRPVLLSCGLLQARDEAQNQVASCLFIDTHSKNI